MFLIIMSDEHDFSRWFSRGSMDCPTHLNEDKHHSARRFARRVYLPRVIGLATGFFCVASVLVMQPLSGWWWLLLVANGFIWPHLAWQVADRAADPARAEIRNLLVDSLMGGVWIAAMGLNALPSALIVALMSMNNMGCGGVKLFLSGLALLVCACAITLGLIHIPLNLETMPSQVWICLPLLIIYPIYYGLVSYRTAIKLAEHKRRLMQLSTRDGMTGVYNRRHWEHLLHGEYENCQRYQRNATLLLIDIDHFKAINDTFGHDVGDEAIVAITEHLQLTLRITDVVGRFGGDEFGVIMSGTPQENAIQAMMRVREHLDTFRLPCAPQVSLQVSVGVAEFDHRMASYREWLKAADLALYKAKNAGRGRIEAAA
ncbi:diguanylate cyclase AdrA [Enterobacter sp. R1(2018)]|uniref:diguanylate cyclase AdrA n=1 Tax=Enterobacter sp. R1(2018) TaxID=2447891 RepID=UPI00217D96DF|nr:diguanylate cyclase AdrA [Enterobacter sp. R1(2018)]